MHSSLPPSSSMQLSKLQSLHHWKKRQSDSHSAKQGISLKKELDEAYSQYMELKMLSEQEIDMLKQQVYTLQKVREVNEITSSLILLLVFK